ncbi:MAG: dCTP deaminase, partial [Candidatus Eremiobacteraeota bacterium]|nr:dCTP deaminase [Candidatus Eremiobacteraeota bacterium]
DPTAPPFNTTAIDLRLGPTITIPKKLPVAQRLDQPYDSAYVAKNSDRYTCSSTQPVSLDPNQFVLAQTIERANLPINPGRPTFAARVEGKSSRARLGMLVHFTAPTIHSGFNGKITLEIINLSQNSIQLVPDSYICQLIFERVSMEPANTKNHFSGQQTPAGER